MPSRPDVVCLPHVVLEEAISHRYLTVLLGATNPLASQPGTIRGDYVSS